MKINAFVIMFIFVLFISGCGVSQKEYDNLLSENESIVLKNEKEIEALNQELISKNNKIIELEKIIDDLQNSETRKYTEICNLFEAGNHNDVVAYSREFHIKFNGSDLDIKVQKLAQQSQSELDRIAKEKRLAEEAAAAEAKKSAEEKAREVLRVSKIWVSEPDSAGGVMLYINFVNNSDKIIKYITFNVGLYNAVGDLDLGKYERGNSLKCQATGPFNKGQGLSGSNTYWGKYYSYQIKSAKLFGAHIEYMDGTTRTISEEEAEYIQY